MSIMKILCPYRIRYVFPRSWFGKVSGVFTFSAPFQTQYSHWSTRPSSHSPLFVRPPFPFCFCLSIFLLPSQAPNPSLCTRTSCAQSATDWPKARPALKDGSACPALRWMVDTPAMNWLWRWGETSNSRSDTGMKINKGFDLLSRVLLWKQEPELFLAGELPPLSRESVPPFPPAGLTAAVSPSIPPCRRAEWTHST